MPKLPPAGLYGILDTTWIPISMLPVAANALLRGGCSLLQLRMKDSDDRTVLLAQREVSAVIAASNRPTWLTINDRADLFQILSVEAPPNLVPMLHLGQEDIDPTRARAILGPDTLIGLSTHNQAQVAAAQLAKVDYLGVGPVFPTKTKTRPDPHIGLEGLKAAVQSSAKPLAAIGGIREQDVPEIAAAGPRWVVMVSDLFEGVDFEEERQLLALSARVEAIQGTLRRHLPQEPRP